MQDHLEQFEDIIRSAANDQWINYGVIWASIHTVFTRQMASNPDWHLVKYEDLCDNPTRHFTTLADHLGLSFNHHVHTIIKKLSSTSNSDPGSTKRDSKSMAEIWQQRMSPAQIDAVMGVVNEFGLNYYHV